MNELQRFLSDRTYTYPTARMRFVQLNELFRSAITPASRRAWPRARVLSELRQAFPIGRDADGTLTIGGLSLDAPPRYFVAPSGRLTLVK